MAVQGRSVVMCDMLLDRLTGDELQNTSNLNMLCFPQKLLTLRMARKDPGWVKRESAIPELFSQFSTTKNNEGASLSPGFAILEHSVTNGKSSGMQRATTSNNPMPGEGRFHTFL